MAGTSPAMTRGATRRLPAAAPLRHGRARRTPSDGPAPPRTALAPVRRCQPRRTIPRAASPAPTHGKFFARAHKEALAPVRTFGQGLAFGGSRGRRIGYVQILYRKTAPQNKP